MDECDERLDDDHRAHSRGSVDCACDVCLNSDKMKGAI